MREKEQQTVPAEPLNDETYCKFFQRAISPSFDFLCYRPEIHRGFDEVKVPRDLRGIHRLQEERIVVFPTYQNIVGSTHIHGRTYTYLLICTINFDKTSLRGFNLTGLGTFCTGEGSGPQPFPAFFFALRALIAFKGGRTSLIPDGLCCGWGEAAACSISVMPVRPLSRFTPLGHTVDYRPDKPALSG